MIVDYLEIVSAFIIFISVIMTYYNWRLNRNVLFLSIYLVILSIEITTSKLFYFGGSKVLYALLLNNPSPLYMLKGPMLYFFVRGLIRDEFMLSKKDAVHFLPSLLQFLFLVPYLVLPFSEKMAVADSLMGNPQIYTTVTLGYVYPHTWNNIFRAVQTMFYIVLVVTIFVNFYRKQIRKSDVLPDIYKSTFTWLTGLFMLVITMALLHLAIVLYFFAVADFEDFINKIEVYFFIGSNVYLIIPIVLLINPKVLYGFPRFGKFSAFRETVTAADATSKKIYSNQNRKIAERPSSPSLNEELKLEMEELSAAIISYMEREKPYLKPSFKQYDISMALNVPRHHIYICLSEILKVKFVEMKNQYRLRHAVDLMKHHNETYTLDAIGKDSGFASNSNFYQCFKEEYGVTPAQWLKLNENVGDSE